MEVPVVRCRKVRLVTVRMVLGCEVAVAMVHRKRLVLAVGHTAADAVEDILVVGLQNFDGVAIARSSFDSREDHHVKAGRSPEEGTDSACAAAVVVDDVVVDILAMDKAIDLADMGSLIYFVSAS